MSFRMRYAGVVIASFLGFIISILILGYFNRPALDDMEFLAIVGDKGISGAVRYFYDTWNTRWTSIFISSVFYRIYEITGTFLPYHIILLISWLIPLSVLVRSILSSCKLKFSLAGFTALTGVTVTGIYFATFNVTDAYFWISSSSMYMMNLLILLVFLAVMVSDAGYILKLSTAMISGTFIGGANEPFVLFILLIVPATLMVFSSLRRNMKKMFPVIIMYFSMFIAFMIGYSGEGHTLRAEFLPDPDPGEKISLAFKTTGSLIVFDILPQVPLMLLFSLPWLFVGIQTGPDKFPLIDHYGVKRIAGILVATLLAAFIINLVPLIYIMSEAGPARAYTHIGWLCYIAISFFIFCLGYKKRPAGSTLKFLEKVPFVISLYIIIRVSFAVNSASGYSSAWDERMETIHTKINSGHSGQLELYTHLPPSGWLKNAEITNNPLHFSNRHLRSYTGADFDIILSE